MTIHFRTALNAVGIAIAYTAELTSLQGLTNSGVAGPAQAALMPGARVVVTGNPLRDPAQIRASFPDYKEISNTNIVDVIQIPLQGIEVDENQKHTYE